ncbi:MAG: AAA family ATPase [Methylococcales bacterium]
MNEPELLRIRQIRVDGLFGLYNHCIDLNVEERVTILHGPNGVGKTVTLRMVHALFEGRFDLLGQVPFSLFSLQFTDGTEIKLIPGDQSSEPSEGPKKLLKLSMQNGDFQVEISVDADTMVLAKQLSDHIPWLHRVGDNRWFDGREERELKGEEIVARYSNRVPSGLRKRAIEQEPVWFSELRIKVDTHLIEAQRLLRVQVSEHPRIRIVDEVVSTVVDYARDIKLRIRETLARYGQQSQALDQSFPQRVLTAADAPLDASDLKARMSALDAKRNELKKIGLLDETYEHPFDTSQLDVLDHTQKRVMTLYIQDTEKKLSVLEDLAHRARLFLDNVNKFKHKHIQIDREKGFVVEGENGEPLDIDLLSSGEQHEMVLHYDLLFRVRPNALVLIDEPELSLHVAWQKRFLPDLLEIVKAAKIDVLVATHSPFIVGDRDDLMVAMEAELADVSV